MLIPIQISDLELILKWRNNPDTRKNMYTSHEISWEEHKRWFSEQKDDPSRFYFKCSNEDVDIGVVYFTDYHAERGNAFWGFYSGFEAPAGAGIIMEYDALRYAFDTLKLHKLNCEVVSYNKAVINLHKKTGFTEEGVFRDFHYYDGQYHDVIRLGMLASEWEKVKFRLQKRLKILNKKY